MGGEKHMDVSMVGSFFGERRESRLKSVGGLLIVHDLDCMDFKTILKELRHQMCLE